MVEFNDKSFYDNRVRHRLESLRRGLAQDPSLAQELASDDADALICYLLELACQAQNERNIVLGRELLVELPREWLLTRIAKLAEAHLPLDNPWEFRRLLEMYQSLDSNLRQRMAESRRNDSDPEIREVAEDSFSWK
jgi:hypothetical protein